MPTNKPPDVLMTWKDFDTFVKLLREETPTGHGEKQNFRGDVLEMAAHLVEAVLDGAHVRELFEREIKALHSVPKFERFRVRLYLLLFRTYVMGRDSGKVKDDFPYEEFRQLIREVPAEQLETLRPALVRPKGKKK